MGDWDAKVYERVSEPQFRWGQRVLERLPLRDDEAVLDAGCGAGRLTELLADRVPRGRVVALDASEGMLERARLRLSRFGDRVTFVKADLAKHVERPAVDAVFSTATFHWVLEHDALFSSIHASLKPGGALIAQCGGAGNLTRLRGRTARLRASAEYAPLFADFREPWHYATPEETRRRLERTGFVDARAWLEPAATPFEDAATFREFLVHVILRDDLGRIGDEALREKFVDALVDAAGKDTPAFELDYQRLNIEAKRG
ncbi:MAG TPA: methyltransferase domain-containing protein [Polyangiaceae bacterium]|jgi:trans-aconitate methyltransferase